MAIERHKYTENYESEASVKGIHPTFSKSAPTQLLRALIEKNENTNMQIKIGEWIFDCHFVVLQSYSQVFKRRSFLKGSLIELPEEQVSSKTFKAIYEWMISDEPLVQRAGAIELLIAACFLEVDQLVAQIWECLKNENLPGDAAYFLYMEASQLNVECVRNVMLKRISKFFLILVAFKEFLLMPGHDLCILIESDDIGVNTEIEVFMAVLRWLSYDWLKRRKYAKCLMKKVRFSLIPPGFLIELDRGMIENSVIKLVMARKKVRELVNNGLKYATARLCYSKLLENSLNANERHWIYDKNCAYHIQKNQQIEYKITYENFLSYLTYLQKCSHHYWQTFADINANIPSSTRSSGRWQMQISEIVKETSYVCVVKDMTKKTNESSIPEEVRKLKISNYGSFKNPEENAKSIDKPHCTLMKEQSIQSTVKYFKESCVETSFQGKQDENKLSEVIDSNFVESPKFEKNAYQFTRQNSNSSRTTIDFSDKASIKNKSSSRFNNQKYYYIDSESKISEFHEDNDHSDTNSFVSLLSVDRLSKSYSKEMVMNVVSNSKKSISIESTKKSVNRKEFHKSSACRQPYISERRQDFRIKDTELEEILGNLSISSERTSSQTSTSDTTSFDMSKSSKEEDLSSESSSACNKQCSDENGNESDDESSSHISATSKEKKTEEDLINAGGGDSSILKLTSASLKSLDSDRKLLFKNKTLLVIGGTDPYQQNSRKHFDLNDKILFYGNRFQKWVQLPHTSFGTRHHHAAVLCNGKVYIIGGTKVIPGCKKTFFETSIWALNTQTKKWTFETNLPKNRRDFAAIAVGDELNEPGFYVIGGESFDRVPLDSVWFYNILQKVWIRKASLNTPRYGFSATIVKNEIWIAGGIAYVLNTSPSTHEQDLSSRSYAEYITDTIETFNIEDAHNKSKGQWVESKFRLRKRCLFGKLIASKDNKLFLIGGFGNISNDVLHSFDEVERFDYESGEWMEVGKMEIGRHGHDAVLIGDYIAIIGGVSSQQNRALQSVEFFCTQALQSLNPIPNLPRPLSGLAAVVVEGEW